MYSLQDLREKYSLKNLLPNQTYQIQLRVPNPKLKNLEISLERQLEQ